MSIAFNFCYIPIIYYFKSKKYPPIKTIKILLKDIIAYLKKAKKKPKQKKILGKIQKMFFNVT